MTSRMRCTLVRPPLNNPTAETQTATAAHGNRRARLHAGVFDEVMYAKMKPGLEGAQWTVRALVLPRPPVPLPSHGRQLLPAVSCVPAW